MEEAKLFLISANKSRPSGEWSDDDFDVRDGAADGLVIGRIYKKSHSPAVECFGSGRLGIRLHSAIRM